MSDHGQVLTQDSVRFRRMLPGPVERVWAYLTEPEKRGAWLASGPMDLRVGGEVSLEFMHATLSPVAEATPERYRGTDVECNVARRVTRCEPPRVLAYTWSGDSEVTFELTPEGDEVELVVTHRRLTGRDDMVSVASGWHTHLDLLVAELSGTDRAPFWATASKWEADYERLLAAS